MNTTSYAPTKMTSRNQGRMGVMRDWHSYFEGLVDHHPIFRVEAKDYVRRLLEVLPPVRTARVLDFGCGFGFAADALAPKVEELFLWDLSENMRRRAAANVCDHNNVRFIDLTEPNEIGQSFDFILVNSVAQYMSVETFADWLARWRKMTVKGGQLVISDLIPPGSHVVSELAASIEFSARQGFLAHAIAKGVGEFVRYWKTRQSHHLRHVSHTELRDQAAASGWQVEFLPNNLTYRKNRITAVLK
jgi:SAM-dependent methyltransferase